MPSRGVQSGVFEALLVGRCVVGNARWTESVRGLVFQKRSVYDVLLVTLLSTDIVLFERFIHRQRRGIHALTEEMK